MNNYWTVAFIDDQPWNTAMAEPWHMFLVAPFSSKRLRINHGGCQGFFQGEVMIFRKQKGEISLGNPEISRMPAYHGWYWYIYIYILMPNMRTDTLKTWFEKTYIQHHETFVLRKFIPLTILNSPETRSQTAAETMSPTLTNSIPYTVSVMQRYRQPDISLSERCTQPKRANYSLRAP